MKPNTRASKKKRIGDGTSEQKTVADGISKQKSIDVGMASVGDDPLVIMSIDEDLPPGWTKELKVRAYGKNKKDPYYMDPVSGYVFRSKKDVLRYLETGEISKNAFHPRKRLIHDMDVENEKLPPTSASKRQKTEHSATRRQLFAGKESPDPKCTELPKQSSESEHTAVLEAKGNEVSPEISATPDENKQASTPPDDVLQEKKLLGNRRETRSNKRASTLLDDAPQEKKLLENKREPRSSKQTRNRLGRFESLKSLTSPSRSSKRLAGDEPKSTLNLKSSRKAPRVAVRKSSRIELNTKTVLATPSQKTDKLESGTETTVLAFASSQKTQNVKIESGAEATVSTVASSQNTDKLESGTETTVSALVSSQKTGKKLESGTETTVSTVESSRNTDKLESGTETTVPNVAVTSSPSTNQFKSRVETTVSAHASSQDTDKLESETEIADLAPVSSQKPDKLQPGTETTDSTLESSENTDKLASSHKPDKLESRTEATVLTLASSHKPDKLESRTETTVSVLASSQNTDKLESVKETAHLVLASSQNTDKREPETETIVTLLASSWDTDKLKSVMKTENLAPKTIKLETEITDAKQESEPCFSFLESWSDPCLEFAIKTLTGAIPLEDSLEIQGLFQQQLGTPHIQKDNGSALLDMGLPSFFRTDGPSQFGGPDKPVFNHGNGTQKPSLEGNKECNRKVNC